MITAQLRLQIKPVCLTGGEGRIGVCAGSGLAQDQALRGLLMRDSNNATASAPMVSTG
jgi:hypothetical protein